MPCFERVKRWMKSYFCGLWSWCGEWCLCVYECIISFIRIYIYIYIVPLKTVVYNCPRCAARVYRPVHNPRTLWRQGCIYIATVDHTPWYWWRYWCAHFDVVWPFPFVVIFPHHVTYLHTCFACRLQRPFVEDASTLRLGRWQRGRRVSTPRRRSRSVSSGQFRSDAAALQCEFRFHGIKSRTVRECSVGG